MTKIYLLLFVGLSIILISTSCSKKVTNYSKSFSIEPKSGSSINGTVTISQENNKIMLQIKASGLAPGSHGVHVHAVGDCSAVDGTSAGGHWNPLHNEHGFCTAGDCMGSKAHAGDMGNLEVGKDSVTNFTFTTTEWCINCSDTTKNINHKALIIHKDIDDLSSNPTGNAGARVGCAVLNF